MLEPRIPHPVKAVGQQGYGTTDRKRGRAA
jgi:hypothetical protein